MRARALRMGRSPSFLKYRDRAMPKANEYLRRSDPSGRTSK
jgi:hypothetical protein